MSGDAFSRDDRRHGGGREHYSSRSARDDPRHGHRMTDAEPRRRRSRSPTNRGPRRDLDGDTYSTSRDIREREREDRYRDRRGDREWNRDRPPRRDERDERPPRRDRPERDLFDDRRGRGGDHDGPGRGPPPGRDRKRSASPPKKIREPTPDLTNVVQILERKRRLTQWDIKPPGYDNVTAEQAKLSGMFPLPGAPRQQPMDASRLAAFMSNAAGSATNAALQPTNAKQSKRIFVAKLPASATDSELQDFFNLQMNGLNVIQGLDPCVSAHISRDKSFGMVEFKQPEDATLALAMDGISMDDEPVANGEANGTAHGLSIQRPKDYIAPVLAEEDSEERQNLPAGVISSIVKDSPSKISLSNLPLALSDDQVMEILVSFGELKAFILVKDTGTQQSRGIAFCEYQNPAVATDAVENLNGMEIGDRNLSLKLACVGHTQDSGPDMSVNAMSMLARKEAEANAEHGRVIQLLNMVTPEELMDNDEYGEICADVKEECEKYGPILDMKVPRPNIGSRQSAGIGKIFIKYTDAQSASKAMQALAGRKFADRTVVVTYFGEEYFDIEAW